MKPRFETLNEKKLVGKRITMSLSEDKTALLWQSFMPHRKEINNRVSEELISMQVYNEQYRPGDLNQEFEKWAAAEVTDFKDLPENMESFILKSGLYAVFSYKGLSTDNSIFVYIFGTWLPESDFKLDNRPHFEILGEKYKNNDPGSEEEIWIPVKHK
jgi:AraC family transcriptional regulator